MKDVNDLDTSITSICNGFFGRRITIDGSHVSGSIDLRDFPLLVAIKSQPYLKTVPDGRVHHTSGVDIYFVGEDATSLDYEIEHYDGATGSLIAWVRLPALSVAPSSTTIFMCFGDPDVTVPQATAEDVWSPSYMSVWHLSEPGSGAVGEFSDSTINDNDGQGGQLTQKSGVPSRTPGMFGYGQSFDGIDDHIRVPNSTSINLDNAAAMTLEAWVRNTPFSLSTSGGICSKKGFETGYRLAVNEAGKYWGQFSSKPVISDSNWPLPIWQHVVVTFNNGKLLLFIDGEQDSSMAIGPSSVGPSDQFDLMIGHGDNFVLAPFSYPFWGVIDEVRISDVARTTAWIKTQYDNQLSPEKFYSISP